MTRVKLMIGAFCACAFTSSSAFAVVISNPLDLTTQYLVGIQEQLEPGSVPADSASELVYAQAILDLTLGQTVTIAGSPDIRRAANTVYNYSGTITGTYYKDESGLGNIGAGYDYVLAKYDGQNAGYVLFYLGGAASTIPTSPWNLWTTGEPAYGISHWSGWSTSTTRVPEPATMGMFGAGLLALGMFRRRRARA